MLSFIRNLAQVVLPANTRQKLRMLFYRDLRNIGLLDVLRNFGFLTYRSYILISSKTVNSVLGNYGDKIRADCFTEADLIASSRHLPEQDVPLFEPFTATTEAVLLDIRSPDFSFRNNHLLDGQLNLWGEWRSPAADQKMPLPIYLQPLETPTTLKGTIAYLSDPDPGNYYHWMCRLLPLLRFYKPLMERGEIDYFYVGQFNGSSFHEETLKRAGTASEQMVREACTGDRLLVAITNRSVHLNDAVADPINKAAFNFTRQLFQDCIGQCQSNQTRRLYIQRGNVRWRKIVNESDVIALLERYGFEAVKMDGKTVQEQATLFAGAEAIVALHGAALTNLLFAPSGVKVLELLPYGYANNCFYTLSSHAEADYFYLQGDPVLHSAQGQSGYGEARSLDISVDLQKLGSVLAMMFGSEMFSLKQPLQRIGARMSDSEVFTAQESNPSPTLADKQTGSQEQKEKV